MKKTIGLMLGVMLASPATFAEKTEGEKRAFEIDTKASKVYWTGKKVTGQHTGILSLYGGDVIFADDRIVEANVKMDMNSIVSTDLTNEQWNRKLIGHLKSDDFFSVEKFPESVFHATGFNPLSTDENGNNLEVSGMLTIKGITHEISFPARLDVTDSGLSATGSVTIDRTKFDIKYGSGSFFKGLGDNMIYNDFEITFELNATPVQVN